MNIHTLEDVNVHYFIGFLKKLHDRGLSSSTRNKTLGCLKSFFKFLKKEDYILIDNVKFIPYSKVWKKVFFSLSLEEVNILIETANKGRNAKRDVAIINLLFDSGLRVSELCNLRFMDIYENTVRIMGKGKKERIVPFSDFFLSSLNEYWDFSKKTTNSRDYVFTTHKNKPIDRTTIYMMIKKISKISGIRKNISPHTFRRTFATHLLSNGADIRVVQDLLGHENISTTGLYLDYPISKIQDDLKKYHPRFDKI